ncbi:MAG TPA: enoyl-CoA hydratase-related protein [Pseudonocardiaceae bacterium]|nr:enoyl-CoA hydratase-related protein [Pseudonocardiaceae bacterium]
MNQPRTIETGTTDILGSVRDGVGHIMLNRPESRNALTPEMLTGLAALLTEMETADDVGAVLLSGAGKSFCAGGDVKAFAARGGEGGGSSTASPERIERQRAVQADTVGRIYSLSKPVVAALPGAAAGAGLGFALAADMRIGTPKTVMVTAFAKVGLSGDFGTAWLLHRLIGPARARELMFLSERVDPDTCLELGLLNRIVVAGELDERAHELAVRLANGPRLALRHMKENLLHADSASLAESMDHEVPNHMDCGVSEDHRAAVQAFVAKREPVFGATP